MTLKEGRLLVPDWLARVFLKLIIYLHYSTHKERSPPLKNLQWAAGLCLVDPRGQMWMARVLWVDREPTCYSQGMKKRIIMLNLKADALQQQNAVSWELETEATTVAGSPKLDNHRMENHHLFWVSVSAVTSSSNSNITNGKFIADAAVADHTAVFLSAFFLQYFVDVEKCVGEKGFLVTLVTSTR